MPYFKPFIERFRGKHKSVDESTEATGYLFHKLEGGQMPVRAMEDLHKRRIQDELREKKGNDALIQVKKRWAAQKARFFRESARRVELRLHEPKSRPLPEPEPPA
jgi:hypothetical protein